MSCHSNGPVDWEDDAPPICDDCYAQQVAAVAPYEPPGDPQPNNLLPEPDTQAIDSHRVNAANVQLLVHSFNGVVEHAMSQARNGPVSDADILTALTFVVRGFAVNTIVERAAVNPTAAVLNQASLVGVLQTLIDGIVKVDLPKPVVN